MEEKYTAKQWAAMQGGHSIDDPSTSFDFVRDLNESKMYRTRQQAESSNARDVLDFAFLNMITLYILYNDYNAAPIAQAYAQNTFKYRNFDQYRQSASDLYVALNQIKTGAAKDSKASIQRSKVKLPEAKLRQFFTAISNGQPVPGVKAFFMELERGLDIQNSNYRSVRRLAADWSNLTNGQKKLVVTRLLQFYRTKAIRSELYPVLKKYAASNNLELANVDNAEKKGLGIAAKTAIATAGGYAAGRLLGKWLAK